MPSTAELHNLSIPWPFHTWAFYIIYPISPLPKGHICILATSECYTKWVKVVALKQASGAVVANFIRDNVVYRLSIPKHILSDKDTPFFNAHVQQLLEEYGIDHVWSTPYYHQGIAKFRQPTKLCF